MPAKKPSSRLSAGAPRLIFVDTNKLLEFYAQEPNDAAKTIRRLLNHPNALILSAQVWMEFLKNRQVVLRDAIQGFVPQTDGMPPTFGRDNLTKWKAQRDEAKKLHNEAREAIEAMLADPETNDPIYQAVRDLHKIGTPLHLQDGSTEYNAIVDLARERFQVGKPPRKANDTSFGDAINWEWIIRCAAATPNASVSILTRDGDFGLNDGKRAYLNDYLVEEFRTRCPKAKKIEVTPRFADALRGLDESVTPQEETAEERAREVANTRWRYIFDDSGPRESLMTFLADGTLVLSTAPLMNLSPITVSSSAASAQGGASIEPAAVSEPAKKDDQQKQ